MGRLLWQRRRDADLNDDPWPGRCAPPLRAGQWKQVGRAIDAMSAICARTATWVHWKARCSRARPPGDEERARRAARGIAASTGSRAAGAGELGQRITPRPRPRRSPMPRRPPRAPTPACNVACMPSLIGLRGEGVRDGTTPPTRTRAGGMGDRELLAAADLACQRRCGTAASTPASAPRPRSTPAALSPCRSATPWSSARKASRPGLRLWPDPPGKPLHHGRALGRGRLGLMQVMPATARWTAKKIGLTGFTPSQINDRDTNITIGTAYPEAGAGRL